MGLSQGFLRFTKRDLPQEPHLREVPSILSHPCGVFQGLISQCRHQIEDQGLLQPNAGSWSLVWGNKLTRTNPCRYPTHHVNSNGHVLAPTPAQSSEEVEVDFHVKRTCFFVGVGCLLFAGGGIPAWI